MTMKVVLAIDSFKGCLSSAEAEEAASEVFGQSDLVISMPVSDGGEGFTVALTAAIGGRLVETEAHDPLGRPVRAKFGITPDGDIAIIETAAASGLSLVSEDMRNPVHSSSLGTGEMIAAALDEGVSEIWLGLGGSATCDGGTGMLQALGYRFHTPAGLLEDGKTVLGEITGIDDSRKLRGLSRCRFCGFYDVNVPFCGTGGAARVFAPQKGAGPEMTDALDDWMNRLCYIYSEYSGKDILNSPGAGAAGGIGGAMNAFLHPVMYNGIGRFLEICGFGDAIRDASLVVTGEGRSDSQTLSGKVPFGVLEAVRNAPRQKDSSIPVLLASGAVEDREALMAAGFCDVLQITPDGTPADKILDPDLAKENIKKALGGWLKARKF
jgi:glycerate kinase